MIANHARTNSIVIGTARPEYSGVSKIPSVAEFASVRQSAAHNRSELMVQDASASY